MSVTDPPNPNKIAGYQSLVNTFDADVFQNVEYFFNNLEQISEIAQWNDAERIAVLKSKLKGPALKFFVEDSQLMQETAYAAIKTKFLKYFDQKSTLSQRQLLFTNCKQNPGESVRSYANKVSNLTNKYFGMENVTKAEVGPIVDQTKLAKFLEGLESSLKRLAIHRTPKTFDEAVEQAQLDELNAQFAASETTSINNVSSTSKDDIGIKLNAFLEKQTEISEQILGTLTKEIQELRISNLTHKQPNYRQRNNFTQQYSNLPCKHCGKRNHLSDQCYSLRYRNSNPSTIRTTDNAFPSNNPAERCYNQPRSSTPRDTRNSFSQRQSLNFQRNR